MEVAGEKVGPKSHKVIWLLLHRYVTPSARSTDRTANGQTDEFGTVKVGQRFTKIECDAKLAEACRATWPACREGATELTP